MNQAYGRNDSGRPDLIVEIISPESISRDQGRKLVEYESEKVFEYWLIDPIRKEAEFYQLGEDNLYHQSWILAGL